MNSSHRELPSEPAALRHIHQIPGFWPAMLGALVFATHLYYIIEMADHPFFNFPLVDSDTYHRQALDILKHGWVGKEIFWQAPLYPYFLAACYHFITVRFFDIRIVQALIAAASGVLLYCIGRRAAGRGVAVGAVVGAAFCGPLVYYDCEMLAPVLIVFLYLLLAMLMDRALRAGNDMGEKPAATGEGKETSRTPVLWLWLGAGALTGLAALAHGLALFIVPLVCLYLLLRGKGGKSKARRLVRPAMYLAGAAAAIAPVTLRNYLVGGEFVLISHNGPINFYIGNHPEYDRMVGLRPGLEWATLARDFTDAERDSVSGSSRHFTRKALANFRDRPVAVGRVWLKKLFLFFHADELARDYPIYPVRHYSGLMWALMWKWRGPDGWVGLGFPFGVILPLAVLGWWSLRRQRIRLVAIELIVAGHFAGNMLFFICSRYRIPIVAFLVLYAAIGIRWIIDQKPWQFRSFSSHWRPIAAAVMLFLVSNYNLTPMDHPAERAEYQMHLGYVSQMTRKPAEALQHYLAALNDKPDLTEARFFLGILYQDHFKEPAKALEQFEWLLARDPDNMTLLFNKALSLFSLGRVGEARAIVEVLVENDPQNAKYKNFLDQLSQKNVAPPTAKEANKNPSSS
ncbi:MAG: tetratricopeptide repeat protein [Candidatus Sumerlaeia bacterium]|nr:tetratricopeptide repeat protein [Candidatus Sumerlaeia bacterium]